MGSDAAQYCFMQQSGVRRTENLAGHDSGSDVGTPSRVPPLGLSNLTVRCMKPTSRRAQIGGEHWGSPQSVHKSLCGSLQLRQNWLAGTKSIWPHGGTTFGDNAVFVTSWYARLSWGFETIRLYCHRLTSTHGLNSANLTDLISKALQRSPFGNLKGRYMGGVGLNLCSNCNTCITM